MPPDMLSVPRRPDFCFPSTSTYPLSSSLSSYTARYLSLWTEWMWPLTSCGSISWSLHWSSLVLSSMYLLRPRTVGVGVTTCGSWHQLISHLPSPISIPPWSPHGPVASSAKQIRGSFPTQHPWTRTKGSIEFCILGRTVSGSSWATSMLVWPTSPSWKHVYLETPFFLSSSIHTAYSNLSGGFFSHYGFSPTIFREGWSLSHHKLS